jgi:hypothetical protein
MILFSLTSLRLKLSTAMLPDNPPDLPLPHGHVGILGMMGLNTPSFSKA